MANIPLKLLNTGHTHSQQDNESIGGKTISDNKRISNFVRVRVMRGRGLTCVDSSTEDSSLSHIFLLSFAHLSNE